MQMKSIFRKESWTNTARLQVPFSRGDWALFVLINMSLYAMFLRYSTIDGGLGVFQMIVFFNLLPGSGLRPLFKWLLRAIIVLVFCLSILDFLLGVRSDNRR